MLWDWGEDEIKAWGLSLGKSVMFWGSQIRRQSSDLLQGHLGSLLTRAKVLGFCVFFSLKRAHMQARQSLMRRHDSYKTHVLCSCPLGSANSVPGISLWNNSGAALTSHLGNSEWDEGRGEKSWLRGPFGDHQSPDWKRWELGGGGIRRGTLRGRGDIQCTFQ